MRVEIEDLLKLCSKEDLANLAEILDPKEKLSADSIWTTEEKRLAYLFRWNYFSKTRGALQKGIGDVFAKLRGSNDRVDLSREYRLPDYEAFLKEAASVLGADVSAAEMADREQYLLDAAMVRALVAMTPEQRRRVLSETFSPTEVATEGRVSRPGAAIAGPATALGALAAAQASGFGIYVAATTTLGFLTHAVGMTLPFAVYTGMTSSIAVLIGPAGWLGAGIWAAWKLTGPEWNRLLPALVYLVVVRARERDARAQPQ